MLFHSLSTQLKNCFFGLWKRKNVIFSVKVLTLSFLLCSFPDHFIDHSTKEKYKLFRWYGKICIFMSKLLVILIWSHLINEKKLKLYAVNWGNICQANFFIYFLPWLAPKQIFSYLFIFFVLFIFICFLYVFIGMGQRWMTFWNQLQRFWKQLFADRTYNFTACGMCTIDRQILTSVLWLLFHQTFHWHYKRTIWSHFSKALWHA